MKELAAACNCPWKVNVKVKGSRMDPLHCLNPETEAGN